MSMELTPGEFGFPGGAGGSDTPDGDEAMSWVRRHRKIVLLCLVIVLIAGIAAVFLLGSPGAGAAGGCGGG
jgi:uncharacterized protein involved in exopolysaccharide biosynthesis